MVVVLIELVDRKRQRHVAEFSCRAAGIQSGRRGGTCRARHRERRETGRTGTEQ